MGNKSQIHKIQTNISKNISNSITNSTSNSIGNSIKPSINHNVLIIGAGISGISTANYLHEISNKKTNKTNSLNSPKYNITILEARNRIGGRIHTDTTSFDFPVDLGASWIHGMKNDQNNNPLANLVKETNIAHYITDYDNTVFRDSKTGKVYFEKEIENLGKEIFKFMKGIKRSNTKSLYDYYKEYISKNILNSLNNNDNRTILKFINQYIINEIELETANSIQNLSTNLGKDMDDCEGDDLIFNKGYISLFEKIYQKFNVKLNENVVKIDQNNDKKNNKFKNIKVTTTNGNIYTADSVIVTVPLGILKKQSILFNPELSDTKIKSINNIGFGTLNKIIVEFEEVYWEEDKNMDIISLVQDNPNTDNTNTNESHPFSWSVNLYKSFNHKALAFLISHRFESYIIENNNEIIKAKLIEVLSKSYNIPNNKIKIKRFIKTNWGNDPYSYGSFTSYIIGTSKQDYINIGKPEGRVHFAGEHTHVEFNANVRGAWESGIRVGKEVDKIYS